MSQGKILPNCVGRLDDVTQAIREGKREMANKLLKSESDRLMAKAEASKREYDRAIEDAARVDEFVERIFDDFGWNEARKECGWTGPTYANHVQATAEAYKAAALVYDAPEGLMDTSSIRHDIGASVARDAVESTDKVITGSLEGYTLKHRVEAKTQVGMIMIPEIGADGEIFSRGELVADEAILAELDPDFWLILEPDGYWHGHLKPGFGVVRTESGGTRLERTS